MKQVKLFIITNCSPASVELAGKTLAPGASERFSPEEIPWGSAAQKKMSALEKAKPRVLKVEAFLTEPVKG